MNPQTVTIISGILLLVVFALVGWYVRRRRAAGGRSGDSAPESDQRRDVQSGTDHR